MPRRLLDLRPVHRGFSLVLSMVIMAMMVMVVIVLASFLKVESSLAVIKQAEASARLNAFAAARLAGAALQERLGPDTRVSAPANLYDNPAVSSVSLPGSDRFEYQILGAWRSWEGNDHDIRPNSRYAGRPRPGVLQPGSPEFLDYSSKLRAFTTTAPTTTRFLGWMLSSEMGYGNPTFAMPAGTTVRPPLPPLVINSPTAVPLVGAAADVQPVRQIFSSPISFIDGQPAATTTDGTQGYFCWWVGGENQKVRIIIPNVAPTSTGTNNLDWAQRAKTFGAPDLEAIGYPSLVANALPMPPNQPPSVPTLPLLPAPADATRLTDYLKNATPVPLTKAGFHDVSLYSEGLLTNTATGGLRKDLSLFTETWDFANSIDPDRTGKMPLFRVKPARVARNSGDPDYDLLYQRPLPDAQLPGGIGNRRRRALMYGWADYGSLGGTGAGVASDGGTNFGGYAALSSFPPIRSWAYLTDYCLHYRKYVTNSDPQLQNVTTMLPPQTEGATNAGVLYSYYERIHRHPLIARIQYVFASSAEGTSAAFIAQPVVTLWNPFNVRLTVPSFTAYCKWQSLPIFIECKENPQPGYTVLQHVGGYFPVGVFLNIGGGADITLDPGQTRVFALNNGVLRPSDSNRVNLTPGYVASGVNGWRMVLPGTPSGVAPLSYRLVKNIDNLGHARDGIYYDIYPANYRYSPVRFSFMGTSTAQFCQLYGQDNPAPFDQMLADAASAPRAFGTFAFGLRLSNDGVSQYNNRTGVKTVSKGFLQASPFTTYTEIGQKSAEVLTAYPYASANVTDTGTVAMVNQIGWQLPDGGAFYSPANSGVQYAGALNPLNSPYDIYFLPMTGFGDSNAPQSDPTSNFGGFILTGLDPSTGLQRAAVAELPVKPVQSIPGLQGCDIRATNPAPPFHYGLIGNADASPILPPDDPVGRWIDQTRTRRSRDEIHQAFLQYDDSYCLNHILFDDWFFSSVAPLPADWASLRPSTGTEHVWNSAVMDSMKKNWASFAAGTTTLPNSWFLPNSSASALDLAVTSIGPFSSMLAQPVAYQRVAASLRVPGQFNVNSTSVPAWRALLGSLRSTSVPFIKPGNSSVSTATANNPLARMAISHEGPVNTGGSSPAVLGFAALSDAQLDRLAVEIVKQVRLRGPFLSLSEFVNRQLATPQPSNPLDPSLNGALGTALKALENAGNSFNPALNAQNIGKTTSRVGDFNGLDQKLPLGDWANSPPPAVQGDYLHPKAAEGFSTFGFPGWPRQADVLDRLAPVISVRDETFIVRAMGTSPLVNGTSAKIWCEAVYQRLPEYVDASVPPHEAPLGDITPSTASNARRVNVVLGRRFRLISFRWLTPKEL